MTLFETLGREHGVFRRLIARLRAAREDEPIPGRTAVVQTLLVLLPALKRHDELEDALFRRVDAALDNDEELARRLVEAQHASLRSLRSEIETALAEQRASPFARLAGLAETLGEKLSWHLQTEEMLLWPLYARGDSRSIEASLQRRAQESLRHVQYAVARLEEGVEEVL